MWSRNRHCSYRSLLPILVLLCGRPAAQSPLSTVELGGRAGWDIVERVQNIALRPGWQGGQDLTIADQGYHGDAALDLYADFDDDFSDRVGRYSVRVDGARLQREARVGNASARFDGTGELAFLYADEALLAPHGQTGSFSIDLWIYPFDVRDDADIVYWRGALTNTTPPVLQQLRFTVRDRRLLWELTNMVAEPRVDGGEVVRSVRLPGRRPLVPDRWTFHQLSYDAATGLLAYSVDGAPEAISYLSPSGTEDGAVHPIVFGLDTGEGLVLGRRFRGLVDEFRIARTPRAARPAGRVSAAPAIALTGPIDLGAPSSAVEAIRVRAETPARTDVRVSYRMADRVVSFDAEAALDRPWVDLPPSGSPHAEARGRYVQLRFTLLADAERAVTPRVQAVSIDVRAPAPPPAVFVPRARSVAAGVQLSWDPIRLDAVAGYRVYFGPMPGRYTGTAAVTSPIDVGTETSVRIEGLKPDRAYVFAIETVDRWGQVSPLSREVEARAGRGTM